MPRFEYAKSLDLHLGQTATKRDAAE